MSDASDSAVTPSRMPSSRGISASGTCTIAESYAPASHAAAALCCDRAANSSACSRVMPYFSPSSSVLSPRLTVHSSGMLGLTIRQPSVVE